MDFADIELAWSSVMPGGQCPEDGCEGIIDLHKL